MQLADWLQRLGTYGEQTCLVRQGRQWRYAQLLAAVEEWSERLTAWQVPPAAVVGIKADYSLPAIAALLAVWRRGGTAALLPRNGNELEQTALSHCHGLLSVASDDTYDWQSCPASAPHPLLDKLRATGDAGLILYTSGTSGKARAAVHSTERFMQKFARPGRRFSTVAFLLFDHVAGVDTLLYTLSSGGTLVVPEKRDPPSIAELIQRHAVEVLPASPSFLRLLCFTGETHLVQLRSLKIIAYGSEPMDAATLQLLNERFPAAQIQQKYGTTELGAPRAESRGPDSLWLRFRDESFQTRVMDGVLWVRSSGAFLGYMNDAPSVDVEGWYCTGDLVDVDGPWLRFRGRASEIINVGGEKVMPAEVEQVLLAHAAVSAALVTGEANALLGQIVVARITVREGVEGATLPRELRRFCRERLAPHKIPMRFDIVAGALLGERQKQTRTVLPGS